jgi:hypothetical protein
MFALGQSRRFRDVSGMSALPPIAAVLLQCPNGRKVLLYSTYFDLVLRSKMCGFRVNCAALSWNSGFYGFLPDFAVFVHHQWARKAEELPMSIFSLGFRRSPITRALIIFGAALATLSIGSVQSAFAASIGCAAVNALPAQHVNPSSAIGPVVNGPWSAGDVITIIGTPSANVSPDTAIEDDWYLRFAFANGGRTTYVVAWWEASSTFSLALFTNSNAGGATATFSCTPARSDICPPDTRPVRKNGKVTCVYVKGGLGECN